MDRALPLNMYRSSYTPAEKVVFPAQPSPDDVETTAFDIQPHDQQHDGSSDVSDDSEQVQEYDTDSDGIERLSDDEDVLTFLRSMLTSSGRMVRVVRPRMRTVYCVICVAALSLPSETFDNTGKDIVHARTHNTKELQVLKCNQFCLSCLCRIKHTLIQLV